MLTMIRVIPTGHSTVLRLLLKFEVAPLPTVDHSTSPGPTQNDFDKGYRFLVLSDLRQCHTRTWAAGVRLFYHLIDTNSIKKKVASDFKSSNIFFENFRHMVCVLTNKKSQILHFVNHHAKKTINTIKIS